MTSSADRLWRGLCLASFEVEMKATQLTLLVPVAAIAFIAGRWHTDAPVHATGRRILYYHDPMHPAYRSGKPGTAPDCGMKLEPVYAGEIAASPDRGLQISLEKQQ